MIYQVTQHTHSCKYRKTNGETSENTTGNVSKVQHEALTGATHTPQHDLSRVPPPNETTNIHLFSSNCTHQLGVTVDTSWGVSTDPYILHTN